MKKIITILLSFLFVAGCTGIVTHTKLTSEMYTQISPLDVDVFLEDKPGVPYKKIAILSTNMWKENLATNIDWVKREAAKMGADGIILFSAESAQSGSFFMSGSMAFAGKGSGYKYSFYAIKYTEIK